jgi:hypothetical protein
MAHSLHLHKCRWLGSLEIQCIATTEISARTKQSMTLRIEKSTRQEFTVFTLSGRIHWEQVAELKGYFDTDYRNIILDLREVRLVDRDAVRFLKGCEADGMRLENCPAYVREWIDSEET